MVFLLQYIEKERSKREAQPGHLGMAVQGQTHWVRVNHQVHLTKYNGAFKSSNGTANSQKAMSPGGQNSIR